MSADLVRKLARALGEAPDYAVQEVLNALTDLDAGDKEDDTGICGHMEELLAAADDEALNPDEDLLQVFWDDTKEVFFQTWPDRSGDLTFPVVVGPVTSRAKDQYLEAVDLGGMWEGEYGELRSQLLMYLLEEYTALLSPAHAANFAHNREEFTK